MRVAFIVNKFPALSETFILNQVTGLIDRGHEVDIFADSPRSEEKVHEDIARYQLRERTFYYNRYRNTPANKGARLVGATQTVARHIRQHPAAVMQSLNVVRFGKEAASLRMLYHITPFLEHGPYDIIHAHFGTSGLLAASLQQTGALQGKLITTFYGHDISSYVQEHGPTVYADVFRRSERSIHISAYLKQKLVAIGCPAEKTQLHRIGVDVERFAFTPRQLQQGEPIRLMTTARLVEKKGVEYSIRAVAEVAKQHPNITYRIVGDGRLREPLQRLIDDLGARNNIELVGWKSQDEVRQLYADSHIFVLASVTAANGDEEGQGLVLQEAQAIGLPVVCTRHNGFPEGIVDGESGFLVPERDVVAMAEKIAWLVAHPERWAAMGAAGRRHVEAHFDNNKLNDQLVTIYQQVLGKERV